jgi:hypothetical protein
MAVISGVIVIAAFMGLAVLGVVLIIALFRVSRRSG